MGQKIGKGRFVSIAFLAISMLVFLAIGCSSSSDTDNRPVRDTSEGKVRGEILDTMHAYRGIPYAAPPEGDLRFRPPEPAIERPGVSDADAYGSPCPQEGGVFGEDSVAEDCLFLNVFTPKNDNSSPYPVMVWIHGGAFITGSGGDPGYDAARLVEEDVVVVTLNYRLGALGFLAHETLTDEHEQLTGEQGESGNYGLWDQRMALAWIRDNIESFGGDPGNVTLFGESAGGHSVLSHLVSPESEGLFHRAIIQSGSYNPGQMPLDFMNFGGHSLVGAPFAAEIGCEEEDDVAACLRGKTVEQILEAQGGWFLPMTGTSFLPHSIQEALSSGDFHDVPVLIGSNLHEGRLFVALDIFDEKLYVTEDSYRQAVRELLSEDIRQLDADQIATHYLADEDPDDPNRFRRAFAAIQTDWRFNCNDLAHWQKLYNNGSENVYAYWFTDENAPNDLDLPVHMILVGAGQLEEGDDAFRMKATHTLEIQYVFGTVEDRGGSPDQVALSGKMVEFWTRFARDGNPSQDTGQWAFFDPNTANGGFVMNLTVPDVEEADANTYSGAHSCDYWADPPVSEL